MALPPRLMPLQIADCRLQIAMFACRSTRRNRSSRIADQAVMRQPMGTDSADGLEMQGEYRTNFRMSQARFCVMLVQLWRGVDERRMTNDDQRQATGVTKPYRPCVICSCKLQSPL